MNEQVSSLCILLTLLPKKHCDLKALRDQEEFACLRSLSFSSFCSSLEYRNPSFINKVESQSSFCSKSLMTAF